MHAFANHLRAGPGHPVAHAVRAGSVLFGMLFGAVACQPTVAPDTAEPDLGPIEHALDEVSMTAWPGVIDTTGQRSIPLLNGFVNDRPTAYWFAGSANRVGANVFWFCRAGDTACPLDSGGVVDRSAALGAPVYDTIPGELDYSPFWVIWVVEVPDDYQANELKSVAGIEAAAESGRVTVEPLVWDHGGAVGPGLALMHCVLSLADTTLQGNGDDVVDQPGVPSRTVPIEPGWYRQYQLHVYDFTASEGVFPPDPASESVEQMRPANLMILYRDCAGGAESPACEAGDGDLAGDLTEGAVDERGLGVDLTGDGDRRDSNNLLSGFPGEDPESDRDPAYSALWKVHRALIPVDRDGELSLVDTTADQGASDLRGTAALREAVDAGQVLEPEPLSDADFGITYAGNGGTLFFDCPSQVAAP